MVVGNERHGLPRSWYETGGESIAVPMLGCCDSLNVAAAAAILIYEASLRRKGWLRRGQVPIAARPPRAVSRNSSGIRLPTRPMAAIT